MKHSPASPLESGSIASTATPALRPRNLTLKDVAKIAGLSPITVSRALRNPGLVRPETVERVKQVVEMIGYIPNLVAGTLASRKSHLVAAVVPQLFNPMFVETVQGVGDELAAHGYQLLLSLSGYSEQKEEEIVSAVLSRQPDGIVLTGIKHQQNIRRRLIAAGVPVVETWDLTPTPIDMLVGFSHQRIGEAIGEYLVGKGFRRFGFVFADDARAAVRRRGIESVLTRAGIALPPAHLVPIPATLALGRQGLKALLDAGHDIEVIVCSSDALAHGVITEARARQIAVPGQLAVIGFGDLDFSAHTSPTISSVHIDKRAIGTLAARALLARISGAPWKDRVIDVGFDLVERESTRR